MKSSKKKSKVLKCFICKEDISNNELSEVKRIGLPTGYIGYVHTKHSGVNKLKEV